MTRQEFASTLFELLTRRDGSVEGLTKLRGAIEEGLMDADVGHGPGAAATIHLTLVDGAQVELRVRKMP
jgi:hypothetical protein